MENERNRLFGWMSIALGTVSGLVLGLFSFGVPLAAPLGLEDYSSLPRRLLRLSHIAFVALGVLNVLAARESGRRDSPFGRAGRALLLWGSILLPLALAAAAFVPVLRYVLGAPALLVSSGIVAIACARKRETLEVLR